MKGWVVFIVVVLIQVLGCFTFSHYTLPPHALGGLGAKIIKTIPFTTNEYKLFIDQPTDHFISTTETFKQYYFENTQYWKKPTGPIFLYICGESPCGGTPGGFVLELAKQYNAVVVALEHRYYGKSIPRNFSTPNLPLLSVDQALADLSYFLDFYRSKMAATGKVFTFGGSYAGAMSAWFRFKYPEKTVGALSSSGVVNAILNYDTFDISIATATGPECSDVLRKTTTAFEAALRSGKKVKELLGAQKLSDVDFLYMLADAGAMVVQYGSKSIICSTLVTAYKAGKDLVQTYADFINSFWGKDFGGQCYYDSECLKTDETFARAWRWQTCYELAYFQIAPTNGSIRSTSITLDYHLQQCQQMFGIKMMPSTERINQYYGGDKINGTHIFFSDFSDDPWQTASVTKTLSLDEPFYLVKCNDCGHCMDLGSSRSSDPDSLKTCRQQFQQYMLKWMN